MVLTDLLTEPSSHPLQLGSELQQSTLADREGWNSGQHEPHRPTLQNSLSYALMEGGGSSFSFHGACAFFLLRLNSFYRLIPDEKKTFLITSISAIKKKKCKKNSKQNHSLQCLPALQQTRFLCKAAEAPSLPRGTEDTSKLIKGILTLTEDYI